MPSLISDSSRNILDSRETRLLRFAESWVGGEGGEDEEEETQCGHAGISWRRTGGGGEGRNRLGMLQAQDRGRGNKHGVGDREWVG